jgi:hypothetical protein
VLKFLEHLVSTSNEVFKFLEHFVTLKCLHTSNKIIRYDTENNKLTFVQIINFKDNIIPFSIKQFKLFPFKINLKTMYLNVTATNLQKNMLVMDSEILSLF